MSEEKPQDPAPTATGERLVQALLDPACYPHPTEHIELVETHISWVLLTGSYAYKIKKPVKLPFLDFSTLELRRHFCEEELRVNRRLAPDLYLDVVPIGGDPSAPRIDATPAIEFAVRLKQFDADATADRVVARGAIEPDSVLRLAETLARFHEASAPAASGRSPERSALDNVDELERVLADAGIDQPVADFRAWTRAEAETLGACFAERSRAGAIREGHGDLHLENLVVLDGELLPFDALEFDASMRTIDVIDEVAFVVMDLIAHERTDLGFMLLNRWLEITGDYSGARPLRFYLVYRALVRAKVRAIKALQAHAPEPHARVLPYIDVARRLAEAPSPLLIVMHGLSGSGKTTVAGKLSTCLPAIRIRSDLERRRIHGVEADARDDIGVGEGRYDFAATERTYAALAAGAAHALAGGLSLLADATFTTRRRRHEFQALAARCGARFVILDCAAPEAVLRERIRSRAAAHSDASEATEAVLDAQLQQVEPPADDEAEHVYRIDTSRPIDYEGLARMLRER